MENKSNLPTSWAGASDLASVKGLVGLLAKSITVPILAIRMTNVEIICHLGTGQKKESRNINYSQAISMESNQGP